MATLNIKFPPAPRSGQIVAEINEAGMSFGAKHVFSGANFIIGKGDKIALVGQMCIRDRSAPAPVLRSAAATLFPRTRLVPRRPAGLRPPPAATWHRARGLRRLGAVSYTHLPVPLFPVSTVPGFLCSGVPLFLASRVPGLARRAFRLFFASGSGNRIPAPGFGGGDAWEVVLPGGFERARGVLFLGLQEMCIRDRVITN